MSLSSPQIALDISLPVRARFDSFVRLGNEEPLHLLESIARNPAGKIAYIWGRTGVGRSHLLQAICHSCGESGFPFLYLPLNELLVHDPWMFSDVEGQCFVAIDDVDVISGDQQWEQALFHLFNRLSDVGGGLVCSADRAPTQLSSMLPDLRSRLASGMVLNIRDLDDDGLREALKARADGVGLVLPDALVEFLIKRIERSMPAVVDAIARIDKASLAEKRRPSISLAKRALGMR